MIRKNHGRFVSQDTRFADIDFRKIFLQERALWRFDLNSEAGRQGDQMGGREEIHLNKMSLEVHPWW